MRFYTEAGFAPPYLDTYQPSVATCTTSLRNLQCRPMYMLLRSNDACGALSARDALEQGMRFPEHDPAGGAAFRLFAPLLEQVRLLHVHGGGYLSDAWPHSAYAIGALAALKARHGLRLVATGLGIGPYAPEDARALAEVLARFDTVELRDQRSFDLLGRPEWAHVGCDDTFLAPPPSRSETAKRRLHLCIQPGEGIDRDPLVDFISEHLDAHPDFVDEVVVYEFDPEADRHYWERFAPRASLPTVHRDYASLWRREIEAGDRDYAVVSRFHAHLLLALRGVRGYFMCAMPEYYEFKHKSLIDIGSRWTRLGWRERPTFVDLSAPAIDASALHRRKRGLAARLADLATV